MVSARWFFFSPARANQTELYRFCRSTVIRVSADGWTGKRETTIVVASGHANRIVSSWMFHFDSGHSGTQRCRAGRGEVGNRALRRFLQTFFPPRGISVFAK